MFGEDPKIAGAGLCLVAVAARCASHRRACHPGLVPGSMPCVPARGSARQRQGQWKLALALRPRNGKPAVTDGLYAEAKEIVGGFFIIEAADKDEAVRVASLHPAATLEERVGWGMEVHPIGLLNISRSSLV